MTLLQDESRWPVADGRERQDQRLHLAYAEFKAWARQNRVPILDLLTISFEVWSCLVHAFGSYHYLGVSCWSWGHWTLLLARHSQPEFTSRLLRDSTSGYPEFAGKGHNETWLI